MPYISWNIDETMLYLRVPADSVVRVSAMLFQKCAKDT